MEELWGTVVLLSHAGLTHRQPLSRLMTLLHRTASPSYGHCLLLVGQWSFEYGREGYRVGKLAEPLTPEHGYAVSVPIRNPEYLLNWDKPKRNRLGLVGLALSILFPLKNCSTEVSRVVGVKAKTPDKLYKCIAGENK